MTSIRATVNKQGQIFLPFSSQLMPFGYNAHVICFYIYHGAVLYDSLSKTRESNCWSAYILALPQGFSINIYTLTIYSVQVEIDLFGNQYASKILNMCEVCDRKMIIELSSKYTLPPWGKLFLIHLAHICWTL